MAVGAEAVDMHDMLLEELAPAGTAHIPPDIHLESPALQVTGPAQEAPVAEAWIPQAGPQELHYGAAGECQPFLDPEGEEDDADEEEDENEEDESEEAAMETAPAKGKKTPTKAVPVKVKSLAEDEEDDEDEMMKMKMRSLSEDTTKETLKESLDGSIPARIVTDWETGSSKGFDFVDFNSKEDAKAAKEAMEDGEIDGNKVTSY
ncbi:Zinc finger protein 449 [Tupaia chinensis]|uniref:Zinc finger protein 449 n=1 Tax=Tupaia chinensis TaxID=246437 RepID=L8YAT3_TUPCH|nr:Zinc finger protein 449 [Tupaia chinensis]